MKQGRNEKCNCGSGKKYKHCHEAQDKLSDANGEIVAKDRNTRKLANMILSRNNGNQSSYFTGSKKSSNKH